MSGSSNKNVCLLQTNHLSDPSVYPSSLPDHLSVSQTFVDGMNNLGTIGEDEVYASTSRFVHLTIW